LAVLTGIYGYYESAEKKNVERTNSQTAKANVVTELLPYVRGGTDSLQVELATTVLISLGYEDVALRLATLRLNPASLRALGLVARSADSAASGSAVTILARISGSDAGAQSAGPSGLAIQADSVLTQIQSSEPARPTRDTAAIVTGGFPTAGGAEADAQAARNQGFASTRVYLRNGQYRTVIVYPTTESANALLPQVRQRIRSSAYVVNWSRWCRSPRPSERPSYQICG
jgi:hypothetical protein